MKNNELSRGMLAADGLIIGGLTAEDRDALRSLIARSRKRLRRLRIAVIAAWAALVAAFVGLGIASGRSESGDAGMAMVLIGPALLWTAIFLTASYAVRSVVLQFRTMRAQLADIDSRLEFLCERTGGGDLAAQ